MKKLECHHTFIIKETTQGSNKKMFGPYSGKYVKYTPEEAKKATASGISFKMKPVVSLHKNFSHVRSSKKGGCRCWACNAGNYETATTCVKCYAKNPCKKK